MSGRFKETNPWGHLGRVEGVKENWQTWRARVLTKEQSVCRGGRGRNAERWPLSHGSRDTWITQDATIPREMAKEVPQTNENEIRTDISREEETKYTRHSKPRNMCGRI